MSFRRRGAATEITARQRGVQGEGVLNGKARHYSDLSFILRLSYDAVLSVDSAPNSSYTFAKVKCLCMC
jgi:hypothetical protein